MESYSRENIRTKILKTRTLGDLKTIALFFIPAKILEYDINMLSLLRILSIIKEKNVISNRI